MKQTSPYNGGLTREQFLFYEMRTTAKLISEGLSDKEAIDKIVADNLFQFPTEKSIRNLAGVCLKRLHAIRVYIAAGIRHNDIIDHVMNPPWIQIGMFIRQKSGMHTDLPPDAEYCRYFPYISYRQNPRDYQN